MTVPLLRLQNITEKRNMEKCGEKEEVESALLKQNIRGDGETDYGITAVSNSPCG